MTGFARIGPRILVEVGSTHAAGLRGVGDEELVDGTLGAFTHAVYNSLNRVRIARVRTLGGKGTQAPLIASTDRLQ